MRQHQVPPLGAGLKAAARAIDRRIDPRQHPGRGGEYRSHDADEDPTGHPVDAAGRNKHECDERKWRNNRIKTATARDIGAASVAAIGFLSSFALAPRRSVDDGLEPRTVAGIHLFNHSFRGFHRERPVS